MPPSLSTHYGWQGEHAQCNHTTMLVRTHLVRLPWCETAPSRGSPTYPPADAATLGGTVPLGLSTTYGAHHTPQTAPSSGSPTHPPRAGPYIRGDNTPLCVYSQWVVGVVPTRKNSHLRTIRRKLLQCNELRHRGPTTT